MGPTIVLQAFLQWEPSSMTVCNCKGFPGMNGEEKMGVCSGARGAGGGVVWPLLWRGWCFCF